MRSSDDYVKDSNDESPTKKSRLNPPSFLKRTKEKQQPEKKGTNLFLPQDVVSPGPHSLALINSSPDAKETFSYRHLVAPPHDTDKVSTPRESPKSVNAVILSAPSTPTNTPSVCIPPLDPQKVVFCFDFDKTLSDIHTHEKISQLLRSNRYMPREDAIEFVLKEMTLREHTEMQKLMTRIKAEGHEVAIVTFNEYPEIVQGALEQLGHPDVKIFYGMNKCKSDPNLIRTQTTRHTHYRVEPDTPMNIFAHSPSEGKNLHIDEAMRLAGANKAILLDDSEENISKATEHPATEHGTIIGTLTVGVHPAPFPIQQASLFLREHARSRDEIEL